MSKPESCIYTVECRPRGSKGPWMALDDYYNWTSTEAKERVRQEKEHDTGYTYHIVCYRRAYVTR